MPTKDDKSTNTTHWHSIVTGIIMGFLILVAIIIIIILSSRISKTQNKNIPIVGINKFLPPDIAQRWEANRGIF